MSYKAILMLDLIIRNWRGENKLSSSEERKNFWKLWDTLNVAEKTDPIILKIMMRYS